MQVKTRRKLGLGLVAFSVLAMSWGVSQQLPYVISKPGPAYNVLGDYDGVEIIQVSGVPFSENPGSLDLLTVSVYGRPGNTPNFLDLLDAFFSTDRSILPLDYFYPIDQTKEETEARDLREFETSQADAVAAAKLAIAPEIAKTLKVKLDLSGVVGPSGGLMFALGIIDKATSDSLTGGKKIAGTGTISASGVVGPIGGIDYKMISAKRAGDRYFLAPKENCDEVFGNIPKGLNVFAVETLDDALQILKVVSRDGDISKLPVCSAK
ncbi:MAG: hypothetical protein RL166_44 [Actinomycetota bacterium]